ncbi:L,D-transpeptidase [Nocardioides sp. KR10-350]|uniref:L,D-transpeptidase n=1 Tax=Nocardioides cheoyonin TaxID=3156615 RepID=UPI0032B4BA94
MSKHRADVKPRWGRIGLTGLAGLVVLVALLGAVGVIHRSPEDPSAYDPASNVAADPAPAPTAEPSSSPTPTYADSDDSAATPTDTTESTPTEPTRRQDRSAQADPGDTDTALPADSGYGRRAVFSLSRQRVWIVDDGNHVQRTYPVSGSVTDNLQPGTYSVYSRSENAVGIDDSGTMKWFVRFAHGVNAAIGFHDIPVKDGLPLQTVAQLGTPQSHGCIRQKEADAKAMWDFAQLGTTVVVTA